MQAEFAKKIADAKIQTKDLKCESITSFQLTTANMGRAFNW